MFMTPLFAAILSLLYVYLSYAVIRLRMIHRLGSGSGDIVALERAIRAHANFAEYVPLTLILLWFVETLTMSSTLVLLFGSVFVLGRIMHVVGMLQPKRWMILRQIGMVATLSVIAILALYLLYWYYPIGL